MHISCILLITLNLLLAIGNLLLPASYYSNPVTGDLLLMTSICYLIFAVTILSMGALIPEKGITLSGKMLFIFGLLKLVYGITRGSPGRIDLPVGRRHLTKGWNAPGIMIIGILLSIPNLFSMLLVSEVESLNPVEAAKALINNPTGLVLAGMLFTWFLLIITSWIWYYIDTKHTIKVPDNIENQSQDGDKNSMAKCGSCGEFYDYDRHDGSCPKCGKYNRPSATSYNENRYKKNKAALNVFRIFILIILIFAGAVILPHAKAFIEKLNPPEPTNINVPVVNLPIGGTGNAGSENMEFTSEEIDDLLVKIEEKYELEIIYHRELYQNNEKDESGRRYNQVTILIATEESETVYWFQFLKYQEKTDEYEAGEIVFYTAAESESLKKSDIMAD